MEKLPQKTTEQVYQEAMNMLKTGFTLNVEISRGFGFIHYVDTSNGGFELEIIKYKLKGDS